MAGHRVSGGKSAVLRGGGCGRLSRNPRQDYLQSVQRVHTESLPDTFRKVTPSAYRLDAHSAGCAEWVLGFCGIDGKPAPTLIIFHFACGLFTRVCILEDINLP